MLSALHPSASLESRSQLRALLPTSGPAPSHCFFSHLLFMLSAQGPSFSPRSCFHCHPFSKPGPSTQAQVVLQHLVLIPVQGLAFSLSLSPETRALLLALLLDPGLPQAWALLPAWGLACSPSLSSQHWAFSQSRTVVPWGPGVRRRCTTDKESSPIVCLLAWDLQGREEGKSLATVPRSPKPGHSGTAGVL